MKVDGRITLQHSPVYDRVISNADEKSLDTVFRLPFVASRVFLANFDLRSSI